ncbi:hypothetical protein GSI_10320 [Ganoderma sinense ZZ0214-1]|uniref:F-box domain-containing protein n=1 Tax=Ganoderma sinense ZZ0214-1 TaxID=1077348 RepID=A0A2G8S0U6_9APHY|nr:hypothetical protein GSI_10320 [Ganoderma sinense ZZ0214-1]
MSVHISIGLWVIMGSRIENIPVELLVDILVESQTPRTTPDKGPFEDVIEEWQRPATNWTLLMRVCRRFRNVIIDTSSLWARIPVTSNIVALQERLSRSRNSRLHLLFSGPCESALPFILPHTLRIRAIVTTPRFRVDSLASLIPLLKRSLPALERVHLDTARMNSDRGFIDRSKIEEVGSVLDETLHPRVNAVTLPRLLLPPKESGFWSQKLLHFDIRANYGIVSVTDRDDILAILRSTPQLESLVIIFPERAMPRDFNPQMLGVMPALFMGASRVEPAPLLRLRALTLLGPAWLTGPVLHGLDTPALEKLFVNTTDPYDVAAGVTLMFPARIRPLFSRDKRLHIHAGARGGGFRFGDCHCEAGRISSERLYLRVDTTQGHPSFPLLVLCRLFGEAKLDTLELSYFRGVEPEECGAWREVLETFPGLKKVRLFNNEKQSGAAMLAEIEALQKDGLNPEMEVEVEDAPW